MLSSVYWLAALSVVATVATVASESSVVFIFFLIDYVSDEMEKRGVAVM